MKKFRKLIAAVAAMATMLTSFAQVSAMTNDAGIQYRDAFYDRNNGGTIPVGTYYLSDRSNVSYRVFDYGSKYSSCEIAESDSTSGSRSMAIQGWGYKGAEGGFARLTIYFGTVSYNHRYKISFNLTRDGKTSGDYVALNGGEKDGGARLSHNTIWTVTDKGTGSASGGVGSREWQHYEATLETLADDPQLDFVAVGGWGKYFVDDIVVTDDMNRVIFSEDFEKDAPESLLTTEWTYNGTEGACDYKIVSDLSSGSTNHSLQIHSHDKGVSYISVTVPSVESNQYTLTYDTMADFNGDYFRYVSIDFAGNNIYGTYRIPSSATTSHSVSINSSGNTELKIAATGYAKVRIDNIKLTDKYGDVVFFENFENIHVIDGEDVRSTYKDGWEKTLASNAKATFEVIEDNSGHVLKVEGHVNGDSTDMIGRYRIALPKKSSDNTYKISYDLRLKTNKTSTSASIDLTGTNIYGSGQLTKAEENDEYEHKEITFTGTSEYLIIAATSYSEAWVDNIVVKDNDDNVLFTEDFEDFDEKYTYYAYETRLHGLSANGIGNRIYLSWKNPIRSDISSIEVYEDDAEVNVGGAVSLNSGEPNIVTVAVNQGAGTVHTYDVRMVTSSGFVFHNYVSAKESERFLDSGKTKDGIALQGWRISAGDGTDVKGLGSVYYDTDNKAVGNTSLHINPNITKLSVDQLDADKTSVMVVYGDGEAKAHFYLDALVDGLEENATYRLTWKHKGHHAPSYHLYSQGFKVADDSTSIGKVTVQGGYTNYTCWQSRELEFTVKSGSITSGLPSLRFDFDNGTDDFWLDDVKLVKVGGDGTNLIANGSFEYGLSELARNGNNVTWELADSNDGVNVYRSAGDTNVKIASLAKGTESYVIPAFEGTKQTLVFCTVKKSGDTEFVSNPYTIDLTQDSYIYDAKFEIVNDSFEAIGVPQNLTGDIYLKTSVKIENATNQLMGADLYTLIYKGGVLLNIDKNTVSTNTGEINCSTVMSVPDVSDGVYSAKVFVWNMGDFIPLKQAKTLDE